MLCSVCLDSLDRLSKILPSDNGRKWVVHHETRESFEASVAAGCFLCLRYWDSIPSDFWPRITGVMRKWSNTHDLDEGPVDPPVKCVTLASVIHYPCWDSRPHEDSLYLDLPEKHSWPWRDWFYMPNTIKYINFVSGCNDDSGGSAAMTPCSSSNTFSEESFTRARAWIRDCIETHTNCNKPTESQEGWYPTRLLDVGPLAMDRGDHQPIRLVVTKEDPPESGDQYATLSHRWGKQTFLQLTRHNLDELRKEINLDQLTTTFRDAVLATRKLGFRYLWIDSLCIRQDPDDKSDWLTEAAMMDKVYMNCACNLSATGASQEDGGLFFDRDPGFSDNTVTLSSRILPHRLVDCHGVEPCADLTEDTADISGTYRIVDRYIWHHSVNRAPLNWRGWVFQERLLSPRGLFFGRLELLWECREMAASESHPTGLRSEYRGKPFKGVLHGLTDSPDGPYDEWHFIVNKYISMELTVPTDKLVALSGVAKLFSARLGDEYVAGLWRKSLEHQLLWSVHHGDRPTVYRAPSWSWASLDVKIYGLGRFTLHDPPEMAIEIIDVQLDYELPGDVTGPVTGGYLDLKCHVQPVTLIADTSGVMMDWQVTGPQHAQKTQVNIDSEDDALDPNGALSYCVPVGKGRCTSPETIEHYIYYLLASADETKGTFRRIGIAVEKSREEFEASLLPKDTDKDVPCLAYADGWHTIRII